MSTALRALAKAGVAGLLPIVLALAWSGSSGTTAQASPGGPLAPAAMRPDGLGPGGSGRPSDHLSVRIILPGPYDTAAWNAGPSPFASGTFVPTPGSPIGPRAARLAEHLEHRHAATTARHAALP